MLKTITISHAFLSEAVTIDIGSPEKSGFSITDVDGLGPPEAEISLTKLLTGDGSVFNTSRINSRTLVLYITLVSPNNLGKSIEDLRLLLYTIFPVKRQLSLKLVSDSRDVVIDGYCERIDTGGFMPITTATVSIVCPSVFFKSSTIYDVLFSGATGGFTFPFKNNSLTQDLLTLKSIQTHQEYYIQYSGEGDCGVRLHIQCLGSIGDLTIYNSGTQETFFLDSSIIAEITGAPLGLDDQVIIDTNIGKKSVTLFRDGVGWNILNSMSFDSSWFTLTPGLNIFGYIATTGAEYVQLSASYRHLFLGL